MIYNVKVAEHMVKAGLFIWKSEPDSPDAARTALYLGLVACELTLKALLERAGVPVEKLKSYNHNFEKILDVFSACTVEVEVAQGNVQRVPASRVRSIKAALSTVGNILSAESQGVSKYPNEVRYGESVVHFPPFTILSGASELIRWYGGIGSTIRFDGQLP